jgi:Purple acid Phosphatase, N-terminal domain
MHRVFRRFVMTVMVGSQLYSNPGFSQESPTTKKAANIRMTKEPEIERNDFVVIVRWTSNNPGGSPEHYGVVHYGVNPKELNQIAKSPLRLNPGHSETIFRVRIDDLKSGTTYYYMVDSMKANGNSDGVKDTIHHFTTR